MQAVGHTKFDSMDALYPLLPALPIYSCTISGSASANVQVGRKPSSRCIFPALYQAESSNFPSVTLSHRHRRLRHLLILYPSRQPAATPPGGLTSV